jgi:threonine dehydratase
MIRLHNIILAQQQLKPYLRPTPLLYSLALSEQSGAEVWLKLECRQPTGSFKVRGALYKMMSLSAEARAKGVVTASAGNHGLGTAFAAQALGVTPATIFIPQTAPQAKVSKLRRYPITLRQVGETYEAAHQQATS